LSLDAHIRNSLLHFPASPVSKPESGIPPFWPEFVKFWLSNGFAAITLHSAETRFAAKFLIDEKFLNY
jgi:hypothetical protein